mgnify:CR=1 FL=1|jgi:diguanylate cyclase (GGDEF)-like protein/PAS domain S-box-containing protein
MVAVYFVYGLVFFVLALVVLAYPKRLGAPRLKEALWYLGMFALVHALNEWAEMFRLLGPPFGSWRLQAVGSLLLLPLSFYFLVAFGATAMPEGARWLRYVPFGLLAVWAVAVAPSGVEPLRANILARYMLGAPGAVLGAWALWRQQPYLREAPRGIRRCLRLSSGALLAYGLLAGLVVPQDRVLAASVLNYELIREALGVPIQVLRTGCAAVLTFAVVRTMGLFEWEALRSLREANERLEERVRERTKALEDSLRFMESIFQSIQDPFIIVDREFKIIKANEAYAQLKGIPTKELLGRPCYEATRGRSSVCADCVVEKTFRSKDPCAKEKAVEVNGHEHWVEIYTYPVLDARGQVSHVVEYVRNATERKRGEEERKRLIKELEELSRTDALTGLLNRRGLIDRLQYELRRAERYGTVTSLVLVDMDHFKDINDRFGHKGGDRVLQEVAKGLLQMVRTADIVGRYGGDEFMLILPQTSLQGAQELAERIRLSIAQSRLPVGEGLYAQSTVSIGVASFAGQVDVDTLLERIDSALYASKKLGRNRLYVLG